MTNPRPAPKGQLIFQIKETNQSNEVLLRIRGTDRSWQFPKDVAETIIKWNDTYPRLLDALEEEHNKDCDCLDGDNGCSVGDLLRECKGETK